MNYNILNKLVEYIEDNLLDEIDLDYISRKLGLNSFIMQRVFSILSNLSIKEYIRKRKLSLAYEEIKNTNNKIIEIALKYGYESSFSFTRSFKKEFNITPREARKISDKKFKMLPRINFEFNYLYNKIYDFRIININHFNLYGDLVFADTLDDLYYKIRELYKKIKSNKMYDFYNTNKRYAVSYFKKGKYYYLVGSEKMESSKSIIDIAGGEYAVFEVGSVNQKDIQNVFEFINKIWNKSSNYYVNKETIIEAYEENNCFIYMPIKKKQN